MRFGVVGALATATHVATAWLALRGLGLDAAPANGIAFVVASIVSYAGNTWWGFSARPALRNVWRFGLVSLVALVLTMAIAGAVEAAGGHDALGIMAVVTLVPAATFAAHRHFTYRR